MNDFSSLLAKKSGYQHGIRQWEDFLFCWKNVFTNLDDLPFGELVYFPEPVNNESPLIKSDYSGCTCLPQSLVDFHEAYTGMGGGYRNHNISDGIGFFEVSEIKTLSSYDPSFCEIRNQHPINSTDSEYFRYGIDQDYNDVRTEYSKEALVIAQYSFDGSELMILYPNSQTSDGEMEVAILGKAWEFRAPSFAEMMRQLSLYCLTEATSMPPYKQNDLRNTCADHIKLTDVWWK